ncbi:hypothetical protein V8D89_000244 [Ganoderma adspersum]
MPSINKRTSQIVARPSARGSHTANKVVLGTMGELNRHAPMEDTRQKPELKPWKQASRSYSRFRAGKVMTRRNAGRDDGRTWMSGRYVCGAGLEDDWSDEGGEPVDEDNEEREGLGDEGPQEERTKVRLMGIAKPMKSRGSTRDYEVVGTIRRVTLLEDEDEWEWVGDVGLEREDDHWETIGETITSRTSYAKVLQRQVAQCQ